MFTNVILPGTVSVKYSVYAFMVGCQYAKFDSTSISTMMMSKLSLGSIHYCISHSMDEEESHSKDCKHL